MAQPIQQLADGRIRYSDGSISRGPQSAGPARRGSVLGESTSAIASRPTQTPRTIRQVSQPATPSDPREPRTPNNNDINREIDNIFNEQVGFLNRAESNLRGQLPSILQEAEDQFLANRALLEGQRDEATQDLSGQEQSARESLSSAEARSRQLFDELQRGGQQRFGATSAGQAFGELSAREQQRRQADISDQFRSNIREIEGARSQVINNFNEGLLQLESQKQSAINEANRVFQDRLLEIDRLRAEAGQNKSQMRLGALQDLRNQVFQIEFQDRQLRQALDAQRQQAELELGVRAQAIGGAVGGAQDITNQVGISLAQNPETGLFVRDAREPREPRVIGQRDEEELPVGGLFLPAEKKG